MDVVRVNENTFKITLSEDQIEVLRKDMELDRKVYGMIFADLTFSLGTAIISGIDCMKRIQEG